MFSRRIGYITLVVRHYDEARDWFCNVLGFRLIEDTQLSPAKRWLLVAPQGAEGPALLLAKAVDERQTSRVGDQTGGRVFLFLHTDDFWHDYRAMLQRGVHFCEEPRVEDYGTVAVFEDLYGNRWDLLELKR